MTDVEKALSEFPDIDEIRKELDAKGLGMLWYGDYDLVVARAFVARVLKWQKKYVPDKASLKSKIVKNLRW